jgi:hypothetical protein
MTRKVSSICIGTASSVRPGRKKQTVIRGKIHIWFAEQWLPKFCDCGGEMEYEFSLGRIFSGCKKCTPVVVVNVKKLKRL